MTPLSMNAGPPYAPDTPSWLRTGSAIAVVSLTVGMGIWDYLLARRLLGPYTLRAASPRQQWRWAFARAFLTTGWLPLFGLAVSLQSPPSGQWPAVPLICSGLWLAVLPVATIYYRTVFQRALRDYQRLDHIIRSSKDAVSISALAQNRRGCAASLDMSPAGYFQWFPTAEMRRFLAEGYPDQARAADEAGPDEES